MFGSRNLAGRIETAGMSRVGQATKPPVTRLAERPNLPGRERQSCGRLQGQEGAGQQDETSCVDAGSSKKLFSVVVVERRDLL